jgi:LCP family protein required for cell wall assembly
MKKKLPGIILLAVLTITACLVILMAVLQNRTGAAAEETTVASSEESISSGEKSTTVEKWQEGDVRYDGKVYRYNTAIKTYLIMGIDVDGPVTKAKDGISGGQSDAMFLLVCDGGKKKISVIAINRNTMTDVDVYVEDGSFWGTYNLQICLQHAYGDGMRISCSRSVDAVSRLFYDIPITGYLSINMDGIPLLNDAVGGVTVQVLQDMTDSGLGVELKEGETVTLSGAEAYVYLRRRDTTVIGSADDRLNRQIQYLGAFFTQAKAKVGDSEEEAVRIYDTVEDYLVSNVDFNQLAGKLLEYEMDESGIYTLEGETVKASQFEEFHVDEDALYERILDIFYNEVG